LGQSGDAQMVWNPGDDTDLNEGGDGSDTVEGNGGNAAEQFTTTANGNPPSGSTASPRRRSAIDIGTSEKLTVNANGGDDSFANRQPGRPHGDHRRRRGRQRHHRRAATEPTVLLGGDATTTSTASRATTRPCSGPGRRRDRCRG
jgi:hypothetical protein